MNNTLTTEQLFGLCRELCQGRTQRQIATDVWGTPARRANVHAALHGHEGSSLTHIGYARQIIRHYAGSEYDQGTSYTWTLKTEEDATS